LLVPSIPLLSPLDLELMLRILLSFVLGGVLGYEREQTGRPAGLRTHMLVCAGSVCFTVAGIYGFQAVENGPRDPARVAAQVVSGIGFLGAGTIFRTPSTVSGLTTAASIWLVAGTGMLIGTGMYAVAIFTTGCAYVALQWLRYPSHRRRRRVGEPSLAGDDSDESED
jgi:putative Mg2+ transporter-C (MgtC) family protein